MLATGHVSAPGGSSLRRHVTPCCLRLCRSRQAVRALVASPTEHTFASGGADNLKKFKLPQGDFLHNFLQQQRVRRRAGPSNVLSSASILGGGLMLPLNTAPSFRPPHSRPQAIVNCMAANQDGVMASGASRRCAVLLGCRGERVPLLQAPPCVLACF